MNTKDNFFPAKSPKIKDIKKISSIDGLTGDRKMEFSGDGSLLLGIDRGGTFKVYDIEEKSIIRSYTDPACISRASDFSPDGKFFISPKKKAPHVLYLWNLEDRTLFKKFKGHTGPVHSISFPSNRALVSMACVKIGSSIKIEVKIWDIIKGTCLETFLESATLPSEKLFSSPDGKVLIITYPRKVHICSSTKGDFIADLEGLLKDIQKITFSPDGKLFATINKRNKIKIWNTCNGNLLKTFETKNLAPISPLFTHDGNGIITIFNDNIIRTFDLKTGKESSELSLDIEEGRVIDCSISGNGSYIACQVKGEKNHTFIYKLYWEEESSQIFSDFENTLASGKRLLESGAVDKAYETFKKAISIEGYEENEELLSNLKILEEKLSIKNLIAKAEKLFQSKSYEEAEEEYKSLIKIKELDGKSRFQISDRLEDIKLIKQLIKFTEDLERDEKDKVKDALSPCGVYFILYKEELNKFSNYIKYLSKITDFPAKLWNVTGYIYSAVKQFEPAMKAFKKAHEEDRDNIVYHRNYAWSLYYNGQYSAAMEEIKSLRNKTEDSNDIMIDMAIVMTGIESRFPSAITLLEEAAEKDSSSLRANLYLGELLAGINDFIPTFSNKNPDRKKAEQHLKIAEKTAPYLFRVKSSLEYNENKMFPPMEEEKTYIDTPFFEKLNQSSLRGEDWCVLDTYTMYQTVNIREIEFSKKGKSFIALGKDSFNLFYLYQKKKWLPVNLKNAPEGNMAAIAISDKYIAFSGKDDIIHLWQIKGSDCIFVKSWRSLQGKLNQLLFTSGKYIFSCGKKKQLRMWDIKSGLCLKTFKGHSSSILQIDLSSDETRIISAGSDRTLRLWNVETVECINIFKGHKSPVCAVKFLPDNRFIASGDMEGNIKIWDIESAGIIKEVSFGKEGINKISSSPDGKFLFFSSSKIFVWNILKELEEHFEFCNRGTGLAISSPSEDFVVTGDSRGFIKIWHKSVTCELNYIYYLDAGKEDIAGFNENCSNKLAELEQSEINIEEQIDYKTNELDISILENENNKEGILIKTWNNVRNFFSRV